MIKTKSYNASDYFKETDNHGNKVNTLIYSLTTITNEEAFSKNSEVYFSVFWENREEIAKELKRKVFLVPYIFLIPIYFLGKTSRLTIFWLLLNLKRRKRHLKYS